jgi:hypothetical protein
MGTHAKAAHTSTGFMKKLEEAMQKRLAMPGMALPQMEH